MQFKLKMAALRAFLRLLAVLTCVQVIVSLDNDNQGLHSGNLNGGGGGQSLNQLIE